MTSQKIPFSSPSLSKILVALLGDSDMLFWIDLRLPQEQAPNHFLKFAML